MQPHSGSYRFIIYDAVQDHLRAIDQCHYTFRQHIINTAFDYFVNIQQLQLPWGFAVIQREVASRPVFVSERTMKETFQQKSMKQWKEIITGVCRLYDNDSWLFDA